MTRPSNERGVSEPPSLTSGEIEEAREAARRILDYWDIPSGRMPRAPHSQDEVLVARALLSITPPSTAGWLPISTAPKTGMILVYGRPRDCEGLSFTEPGVHAAYWDEMDGSYCLDGATWLGPFIKPTLWQPLPPAPSQEGAAERRGFARESRACVRPVLSILKHHRPDQRGFAMSDDKFLAYLETQRVSLIAKVAEIDRAKAFYLKAINAPRRRGGPTMKETILAVLAEYPEGLHGTQIISLVRERIGTPALPRTTLSPQISRLRDAGKITRINGLWFLAPQAGNAGGHPVEAAAIPTRIALSEEDYDQFAKIMSPALQK